MHEGRYDYFSSEDFTQFKDIIKDGAAAVFLYARTVLADGKLHLLDPADSEVRAIARASVILVPECFLRDYFEIQTETENDCITLVKDARKLCVRAEDLLYTLDGVCGEFEVPPCQKGSHFYLPARDVCALFEIPVGVYYENMLLVMGSEEAVSAIQSNPRLEYAGGYAVVGEFSTEGITSDVFTKVKDKWRLALIGSAAINDPRDAEIKNKLEQISAACRNSLSSMHRGEDIDIIWGDEPPTESAHLTTQYNNLRNLAVGYGTAGSDYYHSEELLQVILWALEWLYVHMYGDSVIEGRGWRSAREFNWWDWNVGSVFPLTDVLLIIEDHISMEQKAKYLKCYKWTTTFMRVGYRSDFASSRILGFTKTALLLEDPEWIRIGSADYDLLLEVVEEGNGTHIDYVDWTHGYPYNMMYGLTNLQRTLYVASQLAGTSLEFKSPRQYGFFRLAKYMFEAAIYVGQGFMLFNGRGNGGTEFSSGAAAFANILNMIGMFGDDEDAYLKKMIKRNAADPEFVRILKTSCSIKNIALLNEILSDDSISGENDYTLAYAWYTADRAAQHRNDYCFFLGMASGRHPGYESINSANKRGWYTGDGALYLYTHTDRHSFDGPNFIMNEKITYRIPGTTVDSREREVKSLRSGWRGSADFVGCMQFEKKYIAAAMDYESYHFEGPDENIPDTGYGGSWPVHYNDLRAKKAWFMFDRECVCLGTDIRSSMNSDVNTIVEHRRLIKDEATHFGMEDVHVDGKLLPKDAYELHFSNPSTINLEGFAGFWFPEGGEISLSKYYYTGRENRDHYMARDPDAHKYPGGKPFFEMHMEHGKNPSGASYIYAVLPYTTDDELRAYAENPDVEILFNNSSLQAVHSKKANVTGIIFWEAGSFRGITVDQPCIIMICEKEDRYSLSVCEPTHKLSSVRLVLENKMRPISRNSDKITVAEEDKITVTIDTRMAVGRDFCIDFKK